jgi:hypothetical protein
MSFICEMCGAEFELHNEYKQHKTDHVLGRVPAKAVDELVGGEPLKEEVITAPPIIEKPPKGQYNAPPSSGVPQNAPKAPPLWSAAVQQELKSPPKLTYKYVGRCHTCTTELETLTLEGVAADRSKVVAVAWCPNCKKQVSQQIVSQLVKEVEHDAPRPAEPQRQASATRPKRGKD